MVLAPSSASSHIEHWTRGARLLFTRCRAVMRRVVSGESDAPPGDGTRCVFPTSLFSDLPLPGANVGTCDFHTRARQNFAQNIPPRRSSWIFSSILSERNPMETFIRGIRENSYAGECAGFFEDCDPEMAVTDPARAPRGARANLSARLTSATPFLPQPPGINGWLRRPAAPASVSRSWTAREMRRVNTSSASTPTW